MHMYVRERERERACNIILYNADTQSLGYFLIKYIYSPYQYERNASHSPETRNRRGVQKSTQSSATFEGCRPKIKLYLGKIYNYMYMYMYIHMCVYMVGVCYPSHDECTLDK